MVEILYVQWVIGPRTSDSRYTAITADLISLMPVSRAEIKERNNQ